MARNFATNQQIAATTEIGKNQSNLTFAGWGKRATSTDRIFFGYDETAGARLFVALAGDGNLYGLIAALPFAPFGSISASGTNWIHACMTFDGSQSTNATRLRLYADGVAGTVSFSGTIPATTPNVDDMDKWRIGRDVQNNLWSNGDFAEIAVWQATLTAAEVASLAKGFSPRKVRPQSLVYYSPLVRELQDVARGVTLTNTSTTVSNHPRVYA